MKVGNRKNEELFKTTAMKNGYSYVRRANDKEDIEEHWDLMFLKDYHLYKVDVKDERRIKRHGPVLKDAICVEWKNVNGDDGWMFGNANMIAFKIENKFLVFNREELLSSCLQIVDFSKEVGSFADSKNCIYSRIDRKDKISLIMLSDICEPMEVLECS